MKWGLAFYKLCALSYMLEEDFDKICMLDCDVYVQDDLRFIWDECENSLLLYDFVHGLQVRDYASFVEESQNFVCGGLLITQYGGEFVAGSKYYLKALIGKANDVYEICQKEGYQNSFGDEMIISVAAYMLRKENCTIKNAAPYIYRFWTGNFRLVSTCYKYNRVAILHLPAEKSSGLLKIYRKFYEGKM